MDHTSTLQIHQIISVVRPTSPYQLEKWSALIITQRIISQGFVSSFRLSRSFWLNGHRSATSWHPCGVNQHLRPWGGKSGATDAGARYSAGFWSQHLGVKMWKWHVFFSDLVGWKLETLSVVTDLDLNCGVDQIYQYLPDVYLMFSP